MNMKILAVVAAAIIIVAGIGAFLLLQNNDTEKIVGNSDGRLQVYGNANNDDYLNADDVTLIKNIVSKNSDSDSSNDIDWKKLHPYADANNDGKVDSADATVAQNLADRKEGTTVYYLDGNSDVKSVEYPVKSICVLGTATFTAAQSLGLSDIVYGRSGTSQTNDVIYKDIWSKPAVSSTMVDFDISLFSNVADKVSGGIDAIIQNNGGMGAPIDSDTEAELSKLGTQTITMKFDVKGEENYYLTLGFLCGADDKAKKVVGLMDSVYETVDKAVKDAGEKPTVLCCWVTGSMGTGFYASSAASVSAFIPAAGGDLIEIPDGSMDITSGTVGILDDKYNGDFILAPVRTSVSYLDDKEDWKSVWESTTGSTSTLSLMDACPDRTFLFMYGMPFICKVAYAVECMYGSYVSSGYGDDINQKWVEICYIQNLGSDYKVSEHGFCIGKKDFGGESGESGVATSISMYVDTAEIKIGESKLLSYVTAPAGSKATGTTVWKSSDTSVATVDAGTVTGVAAGTATITLTIGSLSTQCTVTVIDDSVKDYTKTVCDADADKIASSFVSKYNGVFGTYTLDPGATSKHASVTAVSGSRTFTIVFEGNIEAASMYEDAVNSGAIEAPLGMPGETISEYSYTGTFDGFCGYKHEASAMATFTALKFAAYDGNVFVNGYDTWQYRPSALATEDELKEFVDAVASSVSDPSGSGAVTPVMGADEIAAAFVSAYGAGSFGTYSVDAGSSDSSATAVATIGTRTPSIVFRVNSAAETLYNNAVSSGEIEALLGMPGETATEFVYSGGFDGCYAYKHEASAMAKFTALKFAAYYGNVYIDGYTVWQYHAGNLATDEEIKELLDALAKAVGTSGGSDKPSAPASIDLSETTINLVAGDSVGIEATVSDGSSVTWSSSDESIAIIADGSITGVAYGTAVITAAVGDVKAECTVNVLPETILNAGADKVAAAFVSSYGSGMFGTYFVESDSDGSSAMVSDGSHYFRILGSYDADDLFETLSASVDAKPDPYANGAKVALDLSRYGFDNSNACTYTVSMGGTMTWMYFAVTEGNMAVDGTLKIQSYRGASSDALFDGFFNALKSAMDHQTVVSADVDDVAAKFVSSYSSVSTFGTMSIAEGSNDMLAIALFETGSRVAPTTAVAFYGCTDASVRFEEAKATMDSMIADMGMPATEVTTTASFDGFYGKAVTMAMGPSAFTMLFFTVYESDVFVDGYSSYQLHRNAAATSEEIDAMMSALASALN